MTAETNTLRGIFGVEGCCAATFPLNPYQGESLTIEQGLERDIGLAVQDMTADPSITHMTQDWGGFEIHAVRAINGIFAVVTLSGTQPPLPPQLTEPGVSAQDPAPGG
ncbi:hypothetical protein [Roseomonas xinghualingensis]|uniref:hypothetical protein n=1 Tax=Roseomonas xinghualingensis TaxID=2986475 RepID=UPI0021F16FBB|nr:hypothetical protein [Roseomonas sp. SXEYE001]MCV4209355.1 hypothetical protein [Roseomonas sp. SXEYE001]